jgi:hypothetical protein
MNRDLSPSVVVDWEQLRAQSESAVLILAAGFEERSRTVLEKVWSPLIPYVFVIRYDSSDVPENEQSLERMRELLRNRRPNQTIVDVALNPKQVVGFFQSITESLMTTPLDAATTIWLDVSGLPMHAICSTLLACRSVYPYNVIKILYTEAEDYFPTQLEFERYSRKRSNTPLDALPASLSSEMADNLILEPFAGYSLREQSTCLLLFAGYEKHRSVGAVDQINPNKLVLIYGKPARSDLEWRKQMSVALHQSLAIERPTAEESISTLDVHETLDLLRTYYEMLYDNHNICIAPICSKMQTVATYLLWEQYRDVQLVFPLPVKYLAKRFSIRAGRTFEVSLPLPPGLEGLSNTSFIGSARKGLAAV